MKGYLSRRIVCVADARSPRGEGEEGQVPKVGARCEAVPGQLLVPGGPGGRGQEASCDAVVLAGRGGQLP